MIEIQETHSRQSSLASTLVTGQKGAYGLWTEIDFLDHRLWHVGSIFAKRFFLESLNIFQRIQITTLLQPLSWNKMHPSLLVVRH